MLCATFKALIVVMRSSAPRFVVGLAITVVVLPGERVFHLCMQNLRRNDYNTPLDFYLIISGLFHGSTVLVYNFIHL